MQTNWDLGGCCIHIFVAEFIWSKWNDLLNNLLPLDVLNLSRSGFGSVFILLCVKLVGECKLERKCACSAKEAGHRAICFALLISHEKLIH